MKQIKWTIPKLRFLTDNSFYHFVKICGGYVHQGEDISKEIHLPLCIFSQDPTIKRRAIAMPRIWRKTTVFTKWKAIWDYLQDNEERQLIVSENEKLGIRMLDWVARQILRNDRLRQIYPELQIVDRSWTNNHRWSGAEIELPRKGIYSEPSIAAIGVKGAAQGGHFTHIHIDDLVGQDAMDSPIVLEGVLRWWDNVDELLVQPILTEPNPSTISIVGTFWKPGDFFCYIQEKYSEYQWRITPCQKDDSLKDTDNITYIQNKSVNAGESNYPEVFSTDHYIKMQNNPEKVTIYWAQHMNAPHKSSGLTKFDLSWLKYYRWDKDENNEVEMVCLKDDDTDGERISISNINPYGFIDPGGFAEMKMIKKGSRNALLVGGQQYNGIKKFVTYTWAGKFKRPSLFMDEVLTAHNTGKPRMWRIDTVGTQPYIYRDILEERDKWKKSGALKSPFYISPIEADTRKDAKDSDIQALISPMSNGEIYIHRDMKYLIAEIASFPNGLTKDLLDMLAKLNKMYWTRRKPVKPKKNWISQNPSVDCRSKITGY